MRTLPSARFGPVLGLLVLSGCNPNNSAAESVVDQPNNAAVPTPARTASANEPPAKASEPVPPPAPRTNANGFTDAEEQAIGRQVIQLLTNRTYGNRFALGGMRPCGEIFRLGEPVIQDASLGGETGQILVVVPITAHTAWQMGNNPPSFPADFCYNVDRNLWSLGATVPVGFQLRVQRWQSGWRLTGESPLRPPL